jgi:hypothetical protein
MFTKNVFTQNDPVADLIKGINEADYKAKMEALKGGQKKIDKNHNGKIDGDDFKILRGEKKVNEDQVEEDTSVKIPTSSGTKVLGHRYGNAAKTHRDSMADPFAVVKGPGQKDIDALEKKKTKKEEIDPNVTTTDTLTGRVDGKSANPFLKAKVKLNVNEEDLDEASFDPMKHIDKKNQTPAIKKAAKDVKPTSYGDRAALMKAGGVKDDRGPRGVTQEEVEQVDEDTMTHITLGKKVKNDDGGHNQDVHYKGKKIGSIESYKHRTGLRYGGNHDATGSMEAGSRSPEEAIHFVRSVHADHIKSQRNEEVEQVDEDTMTHITLGKKVKNDDGGHNQDVHYKGKKIGSIESYKHRTGLRYGGNHDATGSMEAGSRSPEEAIHFVRSVHADHIKSQRNEEVEMNERSLSPAEKDAVEVNVKSMKKNLAGFKARYGKDAKSVMYATATKQAKKD